MNGHERLVGPLHSAWGCSSENNRDRSLPWRKCALVCDSERAAQLCAKMADANGWQNIAVTRWIDPASMARPSASYGASWRCSYENNLDPSKPWRKSVLICDSESAAKMCAQIAKANNMQRITVTRAIDVLSPMEESAHGL